MMSRQKETKIKVAKQFKIQPESNNTLLRLKEMKGISESKVIEEYLASKKILLDLIDNIMNLLNTNSFGKIVLESKQNEYIGLYFNRSTIKDKEENTNFKFDSAYKKDKFIIYKNINNDIHIQHNYTIEVFSLENHSKLFSTEYSNPPHIIKYINEMCSYFERTNYENLEIKENKEMI